MTNIAGIRFKRAGKVYYFDAGEIELEAGDYAVVKTTRGMELGHVVIAPGQIESSRSDEALSPVIRKATDEDIAKTEELDAKAEEALIECGKMIAELNLPMKLLSAEYSLDSGRLTFLFSAEERVDFRELVRRLTGKFKVRVELRQVGSRDEAKLLGSFGRCGRPLCCASFLTEFSPVSIKMAKMQGVSLNPSDITGLCGRLRCCLVYEHEQYEEASREMPRRKKRVWTPHGEGRVVDLLPLKGMVVVQVEDRRLEVPVEDVELI